MSALTVIKNAGVQAMVEPPRGLRLRGLSRLTVDEKSKIINFARSHKQAILAALAQTGEPGDCESCPAAGYWDYAGYAHQGLLCFHTAYYLGKAGKPNPCTELRATCPRREIKK